jgi:hypothetical protein
MVVRRFGGEHQNLLKQNILPKMVRRNLLYCFVLAGGRSPGKLEIKFRIVILVLNYVS